MPTPPTIQEITTAVGRIVTEGSKIFQWVNGSNVETITTEAGTIPTIAKAVFDFQGKSVRADIDQTATFNSGQKTQARSNIGAADASVTVNLTGNQTKSGTLTVTSPIVSTGTPSLDTHVMNRKQSELYRFPFSRPLTNVLRQRVDYFIKGSTTSGDIGEWGWSSSIGSGGSLAYGGSAAFATGRTVHLQTGSTINTTVEIFKQIGSTTERASASSFYLVFPFNGGTSPLTNCAVWTGVRNGDGSRYVKAGWDTTVSPNFYIRARGSYDASETVIDTGVPISSINPVYWPGQVVVDILGNFLNTSINGIDQHKVSIHSVTSSIDMSTRFEQLMSGISQLDGTTVFCQIINRSAANKELEFAGIDIIHSSGLTASQH